MSPTAGITRSTGAVQSYPDKGFYGPAEIDGEILMPFGYQVQLKDANFEQVGEVLEVPTIAHELHVPMNQPGGGGFATTPGQRTTTTSGLPRLI